MFRRDRSILIRQFPLAFIGYCPNRPSFGIGSIAALTDPDPTEFPRFEPPAYKQSRPPSIPIYTPADGRPGRLASWYARQDSNLLPPA